MHIIVTITYEMSYLSDNIREDELIWYKKAYHSCPLE